MAALHRDVAQVAVDFFAALGTSATAVLGSNVQILAGTYDVHEGEGVLAFGQRVVPARSVRVLDVVVVDPAAADAAWSTPVEDGEAAARSFPDERFGLQPLLARRSDGVVVEVQLVRDGWYALARMPVEGGAAMADWLLRLHRVPGEALAWSRVCQVALPQQQAFTQLCFFHAESGVQGQETVAPVGEAISTADTASDAGPVTAEGAVHWVVPCRRLVVRAETTLGAVIAAWFASLGLPAHRDRLRAWYGLTEAQVDTAQTWLARWRDAWVDGGTFAAEAGAPWPRLWLGPLRVLHEGTQARPWWNERREVAPADAATLATLRLKPGDLVELPLFKWLATALGAEAGATWAAQRFSPEGSPFLGTSVVDAGGQPPTAPEHRLHDDLLAMRFQSLAGLARAAFYDSAPTFTGSYATRALHHAVGSQRVYGRGFMYAGTMASPHHNRVDEGWKLHCYHWMSVNDGICHALPQRGGFGLLPTNALMTPGWACTPCVLFLASYLLDVEYQSRGGSAAATFREPGTHLSSRGTVVRNNGAAGEAEALVEALNNGLQDLNVVALSGHEYGLVRLGRAADLMTCATKPFAHQLAAYDPLSGAPEPAGLTYFEAAGLLGRLDGYRLTEGGAPTSLASFSLLPFKFSRVREEGLQATLLGRHVQADGRTSTRTMQVYRVTGDTLRAVWERPGPHGPVVIGDRRSRLIGSVAAHPEGLRWRSLYGTRALPSPTMQEVREAELYTDRATALAACRTTTTTLQGAAGFNTTAPTAFVGTLPE